MAETHRTVAALETVGFFQGFEREEIERLVARGHVIDFAAGATLFREGQPGEGFYVVLSGSVRILKNVPNAGDEALSVEEPGDFFGEMALIDEMPRSATAEAREACRVFLLKKADFYDLTYTEAALGCKMLWALCRTFSRRLRANTERIAGLFAISRAF